jgi:hypothetical protein
MKRNSSTKAVDPGNAFSLDGITSTSEIICPVLRQLQRQDREIINPRAQERIGALSNLRKSALSQSSKLNK